MKAVLEVMASMTGDAAWSWSFSADRDVDLRKDGDDDNDGWGTWENAWEELVRKLPTREATMTLPRNCMMV